MTPSVPDWPRPHHASSPSKASLFYLVFGEPPAHLSVKRARHHVDELPPQLTVSIHARTDDPAWFDGWLSAPVGSEIPGVFGDAASDVYRAPRVVAVRAEFDDPASLGYLRNTVGVVSAIAEAGAVAIFDVHALTWWRPDEWRCRFVERSEFHIGDHIFTAVSADPLGAGARAGEPPGKTAAAASLHTRGLRKFGRPELQVRRLPGAAAADNPAVVDAADVLDGLSNYLARGGLVADGQTMHLARYDATIAFFDVTPPRADHPTFEVVDINPATGLSGEGIPHLLQNIARRRDAAA